MIRSATEDDIAEIVVMGRKFHQASGFDDIPYNQDNAENTAFNLITGEDGILLVDDGLNGVVGGLMYPLYFNGDLNGQELFWWVNESHRKTGLGRDLIIAFEAEVKLRGGKTVMMIALPHLGDQVQKYYRNNGYRPSEHSFIKVF